MVVQAPPVVQHVPVESLTPAPWNPRAIRSERFSQLCRSLEADPDFLEQRPILAQADGTVYAGNHRLLAARHLGWATVPAILADVPDALAKRRALTDNNSVADWEELDLGALLSELETDGADLSLLGFEDGELERLLGLVGDEQGDGSGGGSGAEDRPSLADRFLVPPFSVLDARQGYWQERKRYWLAMGIQSELGRGDATVPGSQHDRLAGRAGGDYEGGHAWLSGRQSTSLLGESEQAEDYRQRRKGYGASPGGSPRPAASLGKDGRTVRGDGKGRALDAKN